VPDPNPTFWLLTGDTPAGPFPLAAIHEKLAAGEVTWDTRACPLGTGTWLPLRQIPGLGPAAPDPSPAAPPAALPVAAIAPGESAPGPAPRLPVAPVWLGVGGVVAVILVAGVIKLAGGRPSPPPAFADPPGAATRVAYAPAGPPVPPAPVARPRLHVTGQDATLELIQFTRGMSPEEAVALGLGVLLTGTDTYAVRVRVTNTGNAPVRVFPENLRVHYGGDAVGVTTVGHPSFLQRGVLQPNFYFEGLVMYRARVDVGAVIRLGRGGLSYADETIEVTYDP
jgi:hypothetical protein